MVSSSSLEFIFRFLPAIFDDLLHVIPCSWKNFWLFVEALVFIFMGSGTSFLFFVLLSFLFWSTTESILIGRRSLGGGKRLASGIIYNLFLDPFGASSPHHRPKNGNLLLGRRGFHCICRAFAGGESVSILFRQFHIWRIYIEKTVPL